ncbi:MAG: hypothetical protein JST58_04695 [Bacteroidetes bacterium]|nr:hypothetical protein [Bacteroidota bacterium]
MKRLLAITNVLSWVNLVVASFFVLLSLLAIISLPPIAVLISIVLIGCIVLHSYAAMQLHKGFMNPQMALSRQTPMGIRMMGFMSMFLAIMMFSNSIYTMQHVDELLKLVQIPKEMSQKINVRGVIQGISYFMIAFSISVILNVVLNFRLLSIYIYYQNKDSD